MRTVAITGAGGYIGQCLIKYLESCDWCDQILGIDISEPKATSQKLNFKKIDIRDPVIAEFFNDRNIESIVHLAFIVDCIHDEQEMYDININGTLNILNIVKELKIPHVIIASSGTAYGAWPDNPHQLEETDPIRLYPKHFSYAHHKGLVEKHCSEFMAENPEVLFNIVRPCIVYGPNTDNYLSRSLGKRPYVPLINGENPSLQYIHEEDVVRLFTLLIDKKIPGTFNAAGSGTLKLSELGELQGKPAKKVPYWLAYGINWILWRLRHAETEAPPGIINYITYPWVLDISRAKEQLGWEPTFSTQDTARIMLKRLGLPVVQ